MKKPSIPEGKERFSVYIDTHLKQELAKLAEAEGLNISTFTRVLILRAVKAAK